MIETVILLLDRGADPNIKDRHGYTALEFIGLKTRGFSTEFILYSADENIVKLFLERGANIPSNASNRKSNIISTIKKYDWWTELHTAVMYNNLSDIQTYEYIPSDINPLDIAIMIGNKDAVIALIERGIQYNVSTCLRKAIFSNRNEIAKFFLENGANPSSKNKRGQTAFHIATERGNKFILEKMFNYDKEIREKSAKSIQKFFIFSIFQNEKRKTLHNEMKYNPKPIRLS